MLAVSATIRSLRLSGRLYELGLFDTQELQLPDRHQLLEILEHV